MVSNETLICLILRCLWWIQLHFTAFPGARSFRFRVLMTLGIRLVGWINIGWFGNIGLCLNLLVLGFLLFGCWCYAGCFKGLRVPEWVDYNVYTLDMKPWSSEAVKFTSPWLFDPIFSLSWNGMVWLWYLVCTTCWKYCSVALSLQSSETEKKSAWLCLSGALLLLVIY